MKLLIVEDDEAFLAGFTKNLDALGKISYEIALSRDSAVALLQDGFFDAVVLDLNLPATDGVGPTSIAHGQAVFAAIRVHLPGTPILILTGSVADAIHEETLKAKQDVDLWGDRRKVATVELWRKGKVLEFINLIDSYADRLALTDRIELITSGLDLGLSFQDRRVLKVLGRRFDGKGIRLAPADGGLSASRVLKMFIIDGKGSEQLRAIGKLGRDASAADELQRIVHLHKLRQGDYAPFIDSVQGGLRGQAGTFYRLAEGYDTNMFEVLKRSDAEAASIVTRLQEATAPWFAAARVVECTVADVRRQHLSDDEARCLAAKFNLPDLTILEARPLQARRACTHGDLHGANVLVGTDGRPSLIDFGDVGDACASIDPVTLELCIFSHPAAKSLRDQWMPDFATPWSTINDYVSDSPFKTFIKTTRQWAFDYAYGGHEVNANAYAYFLRQLKYDGTDKDFFVRAVIHLRQLILDS